MTVLWRGLKIISLGEVAILVRIGIGEQPLQPSIILAEGEGMRSPDFGQVIGC